MISTTNLFSNLNNLTKNKYVSGFTSPYVNSQNATPALTQGDRFKNYQNKIKKNLVKNAQKLSGKEGFSEINLNKLNLNPNGLTRQSEEIIQKNNYSSQDETITNLKNQYNNTLTQYKKILAEISGNVNGYVDRVNPSNPYLNKTVRFTTGHIAYVTNQGVVKYIPTGEIWNSINAPKQWIQLDIPWNDEWDNVPGITIPTNPPLVSGTFMTLGQSSGNEGTNIYVNEIIVDPKSTYEGCYADNITSPLMTFIGGTPPLPAANLQNGSFSQPQIASNSYQYIKSHITVSGWNFYAVLINNSSDWGYPMPYPAGNQAACIQGTQIFGQWIQLSSGTYTLSFYACGRPGYNGANTINVYCGQNMAGGTSEPTVYSFTPPTTAWQQYTTTFNISSSGNYAFGFYGTITGDDSSTAIQNIVLTSSGATSQGSYTYEMCQQAAINSDNRYFALQNVNTTTSQGYCAVSNNQPGITSLGPGQVPSGQVALWASNTAASETSNQGSTAMLSVTGALSVLTSSGQAIFNTPSTNANPSNYLGCYGDNPNRAMPLYSNGSQTFDNAQCQYAAQLNGFAYYGLQNSISGTNAQCTISNDLQSVSQYGAAGNCTKIGDGSYSGGGWSNAVYNTSLSQSNYILVLQDDGNMVIYRGTGPSDIQGVIWSTETNEKQQQSNPNFAAKKGKYGQNYITQGSTLAAGDFIGSNNGSMALIMQSDGNLVLYTFTMLSNCTPMSNGVQGGGVGANPVYNIGEVGVQSNMGKLAFIDENSELHSYPSSNLKYKNTYTLFEQTDSAGYDIPGAVYGNASVEQCQTTCNNNSNCAGFAFSDSTCFPKTNQMYPIGQKQYNSSVNLYVRNASPSTPPIGVSNATNNTDSVTYKNYVNGGAISNTYGLAANGNSAQQQQLSQLQTQLNLFSNQISDLTTKFGDGSQTAAVQMNENIISVGEYLTDLKKTNKKIKNYKTGINNILEDSDIIVLQKNYDYLFWSILAAGSILVAMNIVKK